VGVSTAPSIPGIGEALVRGILESLDSRIAVLDGRGRIVAVNDAWKRFDDVRLATGYSVVREGDNFLDLLDARAHDGPGFARGAAAVRRVMARESSRDAVEYRLETPAGPRWFVAHITPLEAVAGGVVVSHEDVTESVLQREAIEGAHRRLKTLSSRVLQVQEEERRTLSRELHDDVGQSLAALRIALHRLPRPPGDSRLFEECTAIVEAVLEKLRAIAQELRPSQLEQLGLADALRWLADRQARATGIAISCDSVHAGKARLAPELEIACYRIAQEAINNATRHARPRAIAVKLRKSAGVLELAVRDDGSGFDVEAQRARALREGSLGLAGMEERAELVGGRVEIGSSVGEGTVVRARFPLAAA
jgi:signal transduction histidine kinase